MKTSSERKSNAGSFLLVDFTHKLSVFGTYRTHAAAESAAEEFDHTLQVMTPKQREMYLRRQQTASRRYTSRIDKAINYLEDTELKEAVSSGWRDWKAGNTLEIGDYAHIIWGLSAVRRYDVADAIKQHAVFADLEPLVSDERIMAEHAIRLALEYK